MLGHAGGNAGATLLKRAPRLNRPRQRARVLHAFCDGTHGLMMSTRKRHEEADTDGRVGVVPLAHTCTC